MSNPFRIGQIDYLNVWPLFRLLKEEHPPGPDLEYFPGHPSTLNRMLSKNEIEAAPCSSFEFLLHGARYSLLPNMSISARGGVQSVLLCSPVPLEELPRYLKQDLGRVSLTTASATSVALLKILWSFHWELPPPRWIPAPPGQGRELGIPFLEIGDQALKLYLDPPAGMHIIDLAAAWEQFVSLPFVFAVWIVRSELSAELHRTAAELARALTKCKTRVRENKQSLAGDPARPGTFAPEDVLRYWDRVEYDLGPDELASLVLFGHFCQQLSLIPAVPGLSWFQS